VRTTPIISCPFLERIISSSSIRGGADTDRSVHLPKAIAVVVEQLRRDSGRTLEVAGNPFALQHAVDVDASTEEIRDAWPDHESLPPDIIELWTAARSARLFADVDYGQWGLDL